MVELSKEIVEKIKKDVVKLRSYARNLKIGRRCLFLKHCGVRMVQVKVFNKRGTRLNNSQACVDPNCHYNCYEVADPECGFFWDSIDAQTE